MANAWLVVGAAIWCDPVRPGAGAGRRAAALAPNAEPLCGAAQCLKPTRPGCLWPASCACAGHAKQLGTSTAVLMPPSLLSSQVSHDLRELAPLVDAAWEMRPGGRLEASSPDRLPML